MSETEDNSSDSAKALGLRLREARTRNGWTQHQVEGWSGLAPGILSQFESGTRGPSFDNLVKLCDGLRISSDWLLGAKPLAAREANDG